MKRAALLAWLLLLASTLPGAQQDPSTAQGSAQSQPDTRSTQQTVRGCLSGAGTSFSLTETSGKSWQLHGDATVLNRMKEHVGHEVAVTGTPSNASATGEPEVARENTGTADNLSTLLVTNVEQIAETCSSRGSPDAASATTGAGGATGAATATASAPAPAVPGSAIGETAQETGTPPPAGNPPPITSETPARSVSPTDTVPDVNGAAGAYGTPPAATGTPAQSEASRASGTPRVIDDRDFAETQTAPVQGEGASQELPQTASQLPLSALAGLAFVVAGWVVRLRRV